MSSWEVEDCTGAGRGYLRLMCDGKRVCDFFPFARDADPEWVRIQAYRIRDRMDGSRLMKVEHD